MTADAARKRELFKELEQAAFIFALFGIDLGIGSLQVTRAQDAGSAVPGPSHENHVEVKLLDQPVQVDINEGQTWARSPMSEQTVFDLLGLQRFLQQGILLEINHPERQVFARSPIGVGLSQFLSAQGGSWNSGSRIPVST